jgi:hypothetical protein
MLWSCEPGKRVSVHVESDPAVVGDDARDLGIEDRHLDDGCGWVEDRGQQPNQGALVGGVGEKELGDVVVSGIEGGAHAPWSGRRGGELRGDASRPHPRPRRRLRIPLW